MKTITRLSLASALMAAALLGGAPAFAADTANVTVSATVPKACKFVGTPDPISMALDPATNAPVSGTTTLTFWCTRNTSFNLEVKDAANKTSGFTLKKGALPGIGYSVDTLAGGTGNGALNNLTRDLSVTVPYANFANAEPEAYSDTLTVSFNF